MQPLPYSLLYDLPDADIPVLQVGGMTSMCLDREANSAQHCKGQCFCQCSDRLAETHNTVYDDIQDTSTDANSNGAIDDDHEVSIHAYRE